MEAKEATISKILEADKELPLRSIHQHSAGEIVQLDGLPSQQKEAQLIWREHVRAAFLQGQHRALIL